jgi:hypothetical protein
MTPRNYKIRMNLWKNIMLRPQADDNQNDLKEK